MDFDLNPYCEVCDRPALGLCDGCKKVAYCSTQCAEWDSLHGSHQYECATLLTTTERLSALSAPLAGNDDDLMIIERKKRGRDVDEPQTSKELVVTRRRIVIMKREPLPTAKTAKTPEDISKVVEGWVNLSFEFQFQRGLVYRRLREPACTKFLSSQQIEKINEQNRQVEQMFDVVGTMLQSMATYRNYNTEKNRAKIDDQFREIEKTIIVIREQLDTLCRDEVERESEKSAKRSRYDDVSNRNGPSKQLNRMNLPVSVRAWFATTGDGWKDKQVAELVLQSGMGPHFDMMKGEAYKGFYVVDRVDATDTFDINGESELDKMDESDPMADNILPLYTRVPNLFFCLARPSDRDTESDWLSGLLRLLRAGSHMTWKIVQIIGKTTLWAIKWGATAVSAVTSVIASHPKLFIVLGAAAFVTFTFGPIPFLAGVGAMFNSIVTSAPVQFLWNTFSQIAAYVGPFLCSTGFTATMIKTIVVGSFFHYLYRKLARGDSRGILKAMDAVIHLLVTFLMHVVCTWFNSGPSAVTPAAGNTNGSAAESERLPEITPPSPMRTPILPNGTRESGILPSLDINPANGSTAMNPGDIPPFPPATPPDPVGSHEMAFVLSRNDTRIVVQTMDGSVGVVGPESVVNGMNVDIPSEVSVFQELTRPMLVLKPHLRTDVRQYYNRGVNVNVALTTMSHDNGVFTSIPANTPGVDASIVSGPSLDTDRILFQQGGNLFASDPNSEAGAELVMKSRMFNVFTALLYVGTTAFQASLK